MADTKTPTKVTDQKQDGPTTLGAGKRDDVIVDTAPQPVRDGDAALVAADDPDSIESLIEAGDTDEIVVLKQDVVEEFRYPGTKRPSYRVLYHKGQAIQRSVLAARAAEIRAANADRTDLASYIDATTLASGTGFAAQQQAPTSTTETK